MDSHEEISKVLIDALEYVREFKGKVFVIKLGGDVILNEEVMNSVAHDLVLLNAVGIKPVVVHGGGPEISKAMERFGKAPEFIDGLRVTDEETMDIVKMVLIGKVNTEIVARVNHYGGSAVGLSGKSGKLFHAKKKDQEVDLGYVGDIIEVNSDLVNVLLDKDYTPIVSPVGFDEEGNSLNINADTAAAKLALSLNASKLVFMTSVAGVLDENKNTISTLGIEEADSLIEKDIVSEGMIPKVNACVDALEHGVSRTHIIESRKHALLQEILTSKGTGTMVEKQED